MGVILGFWGHMAQFGIWGGVIFAVGWVIKAVLGVFALRWLREWRLRGRGPTT